MFPHINYIQFFYFSTQLTNHLDGQNAADFFDSLSNPEMENLRKQLEDLQLVLYNKDSEIQQLKEATNAQTHQHNGHMERETEVITDCTSFNA